VDSTVNDYMNVLKKFLPPTATILELQKPEKQTAILLADIDGDQIEELIGAFRFQEENYILILKKLNNQWQPMTRLKGNGYGITDILVAPITNSKVNTLVVGWQVGSIWSELELLQWTNSGLVRLPMNTIVYSKLEVEDMPSKNGQDGKYEMAIWTHDTGEAYKVDVYRISEKGPVRAKDVYPYYYKKVVAYYQKLLQTNDFPFYWYYLSDAQMKAGDLEQALVSINKALAFSSSYPSKEKLLEKKNQILKRLRKRAPNTQLVVDSKRGDVTGDGSIDTVFLTADKTEGSPFWQNITLVVLNGKTNLYERNTLKENAGYHPTLFLGDFTGNHVDDILIIIDTGGSGGMIYAYVFSYLDGKMRQVFDSDVFNERFKYEVNYQNNYKVNVTSLTPRKMYTLDLMYKGKDYLAEIYNQDGTLKEPIEGWVDPLGALYPIDIERDGIYELSALQQIAGRYHADGLGHLENVMKWNGHEFVSERQSVSIFGEDLPST
jgi:tetratricopeptide (TPR) repeat protein